MTSKKNVPREIIQLTGVGRSFRIARNDQSLKLQELEAKVGISSVTIAKLEKGQLENSSLRTLNKIADVLGLKVTITIEKK